MHEIDKTMLAIQVVLNGQKWILVALVRELRFLIIKNIALQFKNVTQAEIPFIQKKIWYSSVLKKYL